MFIMAVTVHDKSAWERRVDRICATCLAVLLVPAFFVIVQRFEEWRASRKQPAAEAAPAE